MLLAAVGLLAAACSGGDAPDATGTPSGEREQRAAAAQVEEAVEQAQQAVEQAAQQEQVGEQAAQQTAQQTVQTEQAEEAVEAVEAQFEDESEQTITFDEQAVERAVAALAAHREGLEASRNVLGHPAAPVLIVEYGDFQ